MRSITTHVLDTARGGPARGIPVLLEMQRADGTWKAVGRGVTNEDGRVNALLPGKGQLAAGTYRLTFDTGNYIRGRTTAAFYPHVVVVFRARAGERYHIPLLLSPYGYCTYRGS